MSSPASGKDPLLGSVASQEAFRLTEAPHRIGVVKLVVRDLAAVGAFYRQVIGLNRIEAGKDFERLGTGETVLIELEHRAKARPQSRREAGLFHTAFLLPTREDLGSWLRFAAEAQVPIEGAADHRVSEAIYLADPEGNGIEIYADRPPALWPRRAGALEMATDPLDIDDLMRVAASRPWKGIPTGGAIGHVHLQVGELGEADAFYSTLLGFDVMCRYPGASFYGSGGYHHQLAGNIWNSRGAQPRANDAAGLAGFTLLSPDPAVIGQTGERLAALGGRPIETAAGVDLRDPWGVLVSLQTAAGQTR
jgi:catechol 2,3-dioxygenase